jgi:cytoskeleton protein RodZ
MSQRRAESLPELGQYLKEVRQSLKIPLEQAASELNIRKSYLEALERGAWEELPGTAYGRGYLRQYVGYLGISVPEIMDTLDTLQGKVTTDLRYFNPVRVEQTPSRFIIIGCAAVLGAVLVSWLVMQPETEKPMDYSMPKELVERLHQRQKPLEPKAEADCFGPDADPGVVCFYAKPPMEEQSVIRRENQDPLR